MSILVPLAVIGLVGLALAGQQKKGGRRRTSRRSADPALPVATSEAPFSQEEESGPWPFYAKRPLTPPEQVLYFRLAKALPEFVVLAQVNLSSLLGVRQSFEGTRWNNRINRMSADFVVCTRDLGIVAVIELDGASHQRPDRQMADAKKDKALASAGLRIIRWPVRDMPSEATIRATLIDPRHRPTPIATHPPEEDRRTEAHHLSFRS